jgi:hypothetical protein
VSAGKGAGKRPPQKMGWVVVAIIGAGAAARAAWGLMKAYERLAAARDELDDSLHTHQNESPKPNSTLKP